MLHRPIESAGESSRSGKLDFGGVCTVRSGLLHLHGPRIRPLQRAIRGVHPGAHSQPSLPLRFPALYNPPMVREFGPIHERFEEYILERTTDYPSVVPMVMLKRGKASFRLACKETLNHSNFSPSFDEASLYGGLSARDAPVGPCDCGLSRGVGRRPAQWGLRSRVAAKREGGWRSAALASARPEMCK